MLVFVSEPACQTFRLLIVEDSNDDAMLLLRGLEKEDLRPEWKRVETPEQMAEALNESWDLVISDHGMPRFNAPAALSMLRERSLDAPFIIVSGTMGEEAAVEAMRAGAQDYILKGKTEKLAAAVRRELKELEIRRDHAASKRTLQETRDRLDSATQQLIQAEKLSALGELVAGVAHEINNPLCGILCVTELVLRKELPAQVRRELERVCVETERAARIVKNLLTFARKHPPEKNHVDLNEVIRTTLELKSYHFRVNGINVETHLAPDLPKTMMDAHQIQQVVLNLLNNAEQAIAEIGETGTVTLVSQVRDRWIELLISDTGPGVPAEIERRIFEPFFTTKREGKGTGLGLSLCYGIVQEHGGGLEVQSGSEGGATFVMRLPILAMTGIGTPLRSSAVMELPGEQLKCLVVDDEQAVLAFLQQLLGSHGYLVETACDVPEALEKVRRGDYDLIISDMKMPQGTGREIYDEVRARSRAAAHRIIFTTGDGTAEETRRLLGDLQNEVLFKPYRIEQIEAAIARTVRAAPPMTQQGG